MWLTAVGVYFLAIFHRSSLGVAGIAAAERFDISAAQLSTFTVLQLGVYAAMQIPVGVLIDRYGPQRLLFTGAVLMTFAQLGFAFTTSYAGAVVARVFVGMGDAMVFISVLRLVTSWFPIRRNPVLTAWTALLGQSGALVAATHAEAVAADAAVRARATQDPIASALQALAGVGPVLALTLRAEIGTITRFASPGALASYAGVVPRVEASAGRVRFGRITRTGSPWLRWALVAAAVKNLSREDGVGHLLCGVDAHDLDRGSRRARHGGDEGYGGASRRGCVGDRVPHLP